MKKYQEISMIEKYNEWEISSYTLNDISRLISKPYLGERVDDGRLQTILATFPKQREEHASGRNALLLRLQL